MEVSENKAELCGQELIEAVVSLSRLPDLLIRSELNEIVEQAEQNEEEITLDQLRVAMLEYLEKVHETMVNEDPALAWEA